MSKRRASHLLQGAIVFLLLYLSHSDRLYMWGDDITKLSPGRAYPLPDYGHYIGGRVVDDFFNGFLFESFDTYLAPVFGLRHLVDSHSVYATLMFASLSLLTFAALFLYARLIVSIREHHFIAFSLCVNVFVLEKIKAYDVTAIMGYQLPLVLSLFLMYPFVCLALFDRDVLRDWTSTTTTVVMSLLAYLVAFSITNVELFSLAVVLTSAAVFHARQAGGPWARVFDPRRWPEFVRRGPAWCSTVVVTMPFLVAAALFFDLTSGRFTSEQLQQFADEDFVGELSLFQGLRSVPLAGRPLLDTVLVIALVSGIAVLVMRGLRSADVTPGEGRASEPGLRALGLRVMLVFLPAFVMYFPFLQRLTSMGGKNYFAHRGFCGYVLIALLLPGIAALFYFVQRRRTAVPFSFLLAVVVLYSASSLTQIPARVVSKDEMKGVVNSLFMCSCYGVEEVPVFFRGAELGWPHVADEDDWFMEAHVRALKHHIVGYGGYVDPDYRPKFHTVDSVDAFYAELDAMRTTKPLLCLDLEASPYFIDTRR